MMLGMKPFKETPHTVASASPSLQFLLLKR